MLTSGCSPAVKQRRSGRRWAGVSITPAAPNNTFQLADGAPQTCEFINSMHTITHQCIRVSSAPLEHTHTHPHTPERCCGLQLQRGEALGELRSLCCLNTWSADSSSDWQRLNERFQSLNSIIKSPAPPGLEGGCDPLQSGREATGNFSSRC